MSILHSPATKPEKLVLTGLLVLSGASLLVITALYLVSPSRIIGDALVNTPSGDPFEIPPADVSPIFHVKPVTVLFAALVVFGYCSFSILKKRIDRLPGHLRTFLLTVSVLGLAVCVYEVFFNFTLWSVLMLTQTSNPDDVINGYPGGFLQINMVFATKSFMGLLSLSYFAIESLRPADK